MRPAPPGATWITTISEVWHKTGTLSRVKASCGEPEGIFLTPVRGGAERATRSQNPRWLAMVNVQNGGWRGVLVPPPDTRAAIGAALRHAFPLDSTRQWPPRQTDGGTRGKESRD